MLAQFATRKLMHDAARSAKEDPDRFSFPHAVSVIKRRVVNAAAVLRTMKRVWQWMIEEVLALRTVSGRGQKKSRGVRRCDYREGRDRAIIVGQTTPLP